MIPLVIENKCVLDVQTKGKAACAGLAKMMLSKEQASCRLLTTVMQERSRAKSGVREWLAGWSRSGHTLWVREDAESGHMWN